MHNWNRLDRAHNGVANAGSETTESGEVVHLSGRDLRKREQAERLDYMRERWKPAYDRILAQFNADPDLSRRASFALLPFDMAMTSYDEKIIMVAMDMMRKMYGHDESTVNVNEGRETLNEKLERWRSELTSGVDRLLSENSATNATIEVKADVITKNSDRLDALMPQEKE